MPAVPRLIIVADDLTGTMDVAGPLADRGLCTWAVASIEGCTTPSFDGADAVSINADSRHLSEEEAARRVGAIVRGLVRPNCEILIKKIDSTLRGNVAAETLAMLEASGRRAAVVAPAFPRQGRTLIEGVVHVHGVPLRDTNFARDALSPPPLEPLHVVFRRADAHADVVLVARGAPVAFAHDGRRQIFVVDSASDEELRATLRTVRGYLEHTLLVGSAGVAEALADVCLEPGSSAIAAPAVHGTLLFVVGSRAQQSAQQVGALVEAGQAQIVAAPNGCIDLDAAMRAPEELLVLKATPDVEGRESDAAQVARNLADGVATLLDRRSIAAVVATGGDTALAILQRLSQPVLRVMGNLLPGIPYSSIRATDRELWFVTKAGGFGSRGTFVSIAQRLRGIA
ncbi:MAG TPA: four-carbon acid sugar kinase family protein [Burkholderiales bacterium]|nr:four-carbon acid sugar kinase family protein [Burkholderiales bacterium]